MFVAVQQTTWDYIGQFGVWVVGFPLLIGGLVAYMYALITAERRENQRSQGKWGLSAKSQRENE
jgi:hypothetical protein